MFSRAVRILFPHDRQYNPYIFILIQQFFRNPILITNQYSRSFYDNTKIYFLFLEKLQKNMFACDRILSHESNSCCQYTCPVLFCFSMAGINLKHAPTHGEAQ